MSGILGLRVVFVLAMLLLAAGCGLSERGKTTVRFWNGFTGPDGRTMLQMVKKFNAANPDVHVLMQRMDWSTYYNKLFVAGVGERAPEVFVIHADNLERFMQARFIRSIDDLLAGPGGIAEEEFVPKVWSACEKDGLHYAVPLDVHIMGMYYNKALFRQAGIVDAAGVPTPPRTRAQFLEAARRLARDTNGDGLNDQWGFVFTWYRINLMGLMAQWGGSLFSDDGARCTLGASPNIEALQFCSDLVRREHIAPPPENFDAWVGFRQGKVGMVFEGVWMLADLRRQSDMDYGFAPLPTLGEAPATWTGAHTLCLRDGLSGKELDAAWRFVRFLSENALDWAEGGQIPARQSQLESERFRAMEAQRTFASQMPHIVFSPRVPFIFEFLSEFDSAVEKALRESASPEQALADAERRVNITIERQRAMLEEARGAK